MDLERRQIFEELDRISTSEEFRGKPVMKKLLSYLVTECVEGRSDQIKGYSIGLDVFDRNESQDPSSGVVVRNNAVRLRGLLRTYYLGAGEQDPIVIDIPKGKYVPRFRRRNERRPQTSGSGTDPARAKRDGSRARRPAVAVSPFRNLSRNRDLDFVATGFSQSLSEALTKFDDLRVIGVTWRNDSDDFIDEVRAKGADFFVDGAIQAVGSQVKINFRLLDTADGMQLWGDSIRFDAERDNLFDAEEKITARIANLIGGEYGHVNQFRYRALMHNRPNTLGEQDILLRHYHHVTQLTEASMIEFGAAVEKALANDPDSALLNAIAAGFYGNVWAFSGPDAEDALDRFAVFSEKAYGLNPNHQLVAGTLAFKCFVFDERERFFNLLEEHEDSLPQSPLRLGGWAIYVALFGEWERGKQMLDQVLDNNLHIPAWLYGVSFLYFFRQKDYEAALVEANKYQLPGLFWGPAYRTAVLAQLGRLDEARQEFEALLACRPDFVENGRRLLRCFIKETSLLEHLAKSFGKIGVELSPADP